ncbi:hypothetical protein V9T40_013571 [Parthenolecanium corni]|uniref:RING-type domain-containing protein n=1 Tax=Parthenolecanium corni TaxID=536013 RepID=A0AAN9TB89_9HEMI
MLEPQITSTNCNTHLAKEGIDNIYPCKRNEDPLSLIEKHARDVWLDNVGIRASSAAKFPHYANVQARLKSFASCNRKLKVKLLSEAGFFYHGSDDCTICFHCGGGLKEWKDSDDPWIEHAYWYPRCGFVLSMKGKEYVDHSWGKKQESSTTAEMRRAETLKDLIDIFKSKQHAESPVQSSKTNDKSTKESSMSCKICFVEERNVMFVPCRHIIACENCAANLAKCGVCRCKIEDTIRVFLS